MTEQEEMIINGLVDAATPEVECIEQQQEETENFAHGFPHQKYSSLDDEISIVK